MYCECGCGQKTKIATETSRRYGHIKGQPIRFIHNHHLYKPLAERFWQKVDRGDPHDCWLWTASLGRGGYGQIMVSGKPRKAHRVAWELTHGPIPPKLYVCHHCDNPPCVNPGHLFLGTARDNAQDASRKGRIRGTFAVGGGRKL